MNDMHLFQITLTTGNGKVQEPSSILGDRYTLFAEESHNNASMRNFAKVVPLHFRSMIFNSSKKK